MTSLISMAIPMRFVRRTGSWLALATLAVAGCSGGDDFVPGVPAKLTLEKSAFTFNAIGQTQVFLVTVVDGGGTPVDVPLVWSTSNPSIVKVNGAGLATAISPGEGTINVSYGSLSSELAVAVAQTASRLESVSGDLQATVPGRVLPVDLVVRVTDALNYSVGGTPVTFATTSPGATITPATVTADEFGFARATMTLGPAEGEYTATATVTGTDISVGFTSTARVPSGPFDIEVVFTGGNPTPKVAQAFAAAEERWEAIITSDLPDDHATLDAYACGNSPAMDRPIDDLVIFVQVGPIDGGGGILGGTGVCFLHDVGLLPAISQMTLDSDDLANMAGQDLLLPVIEHEMGHALGYGTLWGETQFGDRGFLADPSLSGGTDPHFTGTNALAQFDLVGGAAYVGAKVPLETEGGYGTADAHWRETVFDNELMTGYVNYGDNPLSVVSIGSMKDLGYDVDLSKADPFQILTSLRKGSSKTIKLHNDILPGPIKIINRQGQIVGTYRK